MLSQINSSDLFLVARPRPPLPHGLTRHAIERLLERSHRHPQWLTDLLDRGHFVNVMPNANNGMRYLLIFDIAYAETLVAIVAADSNSVVTVLTLEQYENTYNAVPPIFLLLAQQARIQYLTDGKSQADASEGTSSSAKKRLWPVDKNSMHPWTSEWQVYLDKDARRGASGTIKFYLNCDLKQQMIHESWTQQAGGTFSDTRDLPFLVMAQLVAHHPRFHGLLFETLHQRGEHVMMLRKVMLRSPHAKGATVDITAELLRALSAE